MSNVRFGALGRLAVVMAAGLLAACGSAAERPAVGEGPNLAALGYVFPNNVREVCPHYNVPGFAYCDALERTDVRHDAPSGYGPSDLQSAYNLPADKGKHQTVAIVDAYDDPNAESDLFVYRNMFGLPVCSTLNGCFMKLNQRGKQGPYPAPDQNWAIEISLDVDMVSAACPNCNIMLIESDTNSWRSLGKTVDEAVNLGAVIINNSYGALGGANPSDYDHPGAVLLASGGDSGYYGHHNQEPADFPTVVAVGGTSLAAGGGKRKWTESVWGGTGSGCSKFAKPSWQHDSGCTGRTGNDIAAVADPQTGVAVYDTYQETGWIQLGGTSASSPINASVFALAGNAHKMNAAQAFYDTKKQQFLYDVTSGSNGTCSPAYLCTGEAGYDGPTGWGTPNGTGAY